MLNKRSFIVKVRKDSDLEEIDDKRMDYAHISVLQDRVAQNIILCIGAYMLSDTLRKCIIHTVATKVNPPILIEAAKDGS